MQGRWGVIFDWDGVIIDSSRQHELSWQQLAEETGYRLPEGFFPKSFGRKNEYIIPELLGWTHDPEEMARLSDRKETLYREAAKGGVEILPGVSDFLDQLRLAGIPCGIGTSTPRSNLDAVIDVLGIRDYFQATVTGEEVVEGKPHPDVFLRVSRALDMPPEACVVFEDAHAGIEAAQRGGMKTVAVATTHAPDTFKGVDRVVRRLDEITPDDLGRLFVGKDAR